MRIKHCSIYIFLFVMMSLAYGVFSSSTPDKIGLAELFIGASLILLVGIKRPAFFLTFDFLEKQTLRSIYEVVPWYVYLSMIYLILVPTITGLLIRQNAIGDYIRDVIPMLYFSLPVLLLHRLRQYPQKWLTVFVMSICVIGLSFSVRFFIEGGGDISQIGKELIFGGNKDNMMQDPATLFAMAFLSCCGIYLLLRLNLFGLPLLVLSLLVWAVEIASILRAPIVISIVALGLTFTYWLKIEKMKILLVGIIIVLLGWLIGLLYGQFIDSFVANSYHLLVEKTEMVGVLNARGLESMVVIDNINDVSVLYFGEGWGGLLSNPIGGGAKWRFVHNMFAYFLFKTGIIGLVALSAYLYWFFKMVVLIFRSRSKKETINTLILFSLLPPFSEAMLLEPMFKSLSFGLVLCLLPLLASVSQSRNLGVYAVISEPDSFFESKNKVFNQDFSL